MGGLAADAHCAADVRPGCPGCFRGCDGLVQAASGLGVFTGSCSDAEHCFRRSDVGLPLPGGSRTDRGPGLENIERAELTEADEADAYHQLSRIGVSVSAIAKKTGRAKTRVKSALKAKASDAGTPELKAKVVGRPETRS
jgi:hypothetical protein